MKVTKERIHELFKQAKHAIPDMTEEELKQRITDKRVAFILKELTLKKYSNEEIIEARKIISEVVDNG